MRSLFCCCCAIGFTSVSFAYELTIDPATRYQNMEGWGTSGVSSNTAWRTAYRDLGLNIIRMPMDKEVLTASADDFATPVTLGSDLQTNIGKFNFSYSSIASYGSFAQWMKSNALPGESSRVKLNGDLWSPPHWMKGPTGGSSTWVGNPASDSPSFTTPWLSNQYNHWYNKPGGGDATNTPTGAHFLGYSGNSIGGRLRTEDANNLQQYGRYLAAYAKGFEQTYGVPVYAMSLQNESTFENPFDSMVLNVNQAGQQDFKEYAKALKAARSAWQEYGLSTKVIGPHVANIGESPANPWALWQQQSMIDGVRADADPTLKDFIDGYNSNYYMGSDSTNARMTAGYYHGADYVGGAWANWFRPRGVAEDGKGIWYSETGDGGNNWLDQSGNPGVTSMLAKIQNALVFSDASAYIYWQFTDGSSVSQYSLLGSSQASNPTASKKYAAFKQFSRYIRPGADRVGATFENGDHVVGVADRFNTKNGLSASAFISDEDQLLTIVILNLLNSSEPITLYLPEGLGVENFSVFRTSATESFVQLGDIAWTGGSATFDVPALSVVTLTASVPEPSSLLLLACAMGALARRARRSS